MSGFLRFTLFVAALCVALVVGYMAGIRSADRGATPGDRLTIDTGQSPASSPARPQARAPSPNPVADVTEQGANTADTAPDTRKPDAPTSIDEILEKHSSQPPPAQ